MMRSQNSHTTGVPYSIYTRNRPLRIAFVVNSSAESVSTIDAIVERNQEMWGGRFNPIILTDGETIDEDQWAFLRAYDPDVVKLTSPVKQSIVEEIERYLSPYVVEPPSSIGDARSDVAVQTEGVSIMPTREDVVRLGGPMAENPRLAAFYVAREAPDDIRRFVTHNLGRCQHTLHWDSTVRGIPHQEFEIDGVESLGRALDELAKGAGRDPLILPITQCCSDYVGLRADYASTEEKFTVIVGDAIQNIAYSWNRGLFAAGSRLPSIRQIWLPKGLADNPSISRSLQNFLQTMAWKVDGSSQSIILMSYEIQGEELATLGTRIRPQLFHYRPFSFKSGRVPKLEESWKKINLDCGECDLHRALGNAIQLRVPSPKQAEDGQFGHWMVDTFIEHASDNYRNYSSNIGFWWKLPPRNQIAHAMFRCPSRICSDGIPSVLVNRQTPFVTINLLSDTSIFRNLVLGWGHQVYFRRDARTGHRGEMFDDMGRSDKGRYLSGMLELFGGIVGARRYLEHPYWRRMFALLSRCDDSKQGRILGEIQDTLRKRLGKYKDNPAHGPEIIESLSRYVLQIARQHGVRHRELTYADFLREALAELQAYLLHENSIRPQAPKFTFTGISDTGLSGPNLSDDLRQKFIDNGLPLSNVAKITGPGSNGRWVVTDGARCRMFVLIRNNESIDASEYCYDERDLKELVFDLTSSGVLLAGVRAPCPLCGFANWYHVNDLRQDLICEGCNQSYHMPVQPEWHYRLNTLVQAGCFEHGLSPVVLVFGELLLSPSASFFYAPCMNLFEKSAEHPYGDLDILCIQDGRFIIGEVKKSVKLFEAKDFEKMAEIAERIRPDAVLFASMDEEPSRLVSEAVQALKRRLSTQGTEVTWHGLSSYVFEPSPVM